MRFKISGFEWTDMDIDRSLNKYTDTPVSIRDGSGHTVDIVIRVQSSKALFYLIFYAHTCIINQSLSNLSYCYNTLTKPTLAGLSKVRKHCIANKDTSLVAYLGNDHSEDIDIKSAGTKGVFSIKTQTALA